MVAFPNLGSSNGAKQHTIAERIMAAASQWFLLTVVIVLGVGVLALAIRFAFWAIIGGQW